MLVCVSWRLSSPTRRQRSEDSRGLLALELAKKADQDETLIAHMRQALTQLEAEKKKLEADQKNWRAAYQSRQKPIRELREERERLRAATHKQFREAALTRSPKVYGRFPGVGKTRVTFFARTTDKLLVEPRVVTRIDLDLPSADGGAPDLLTHWAIAQPFICLSNIARRHRRIAVPGTCTASRNRVPKP